MKTEFGLIFVEREKCLRMNTEWTSAIFFSSSNIKWRKSNFYNSDLSLYSLSCYNITFYIHFSCNILLREWISIVLPNITSRMVEFDFVWCSLQKYEFNLKANKSIFWWTNNWPMIIFHLLSKPFNAYYNIIHWKLPTVILTFSCLNFFIHSIEEVFSMLCKTTENIAWRVCSRLVLLKSTENTNKYILLIQIFDTTHYYFHRMVFHIAQRLVLFIDSNEYLFSKLNYFDDLQATQFNSYAFLFYSCFSNPTIKFVKFN